MDLERVHDVLVSLAFEAGDVLVRSVRSRDDVSVAEKASSVDLVTEVDLAAERIIVQGLKDAFGAADVLEDMAADGVRAEVVVIAEEAYSRSGKKRCLLDDRPTFICDPLDGTVNYVHLFPVCTLSSPSHLRRADRTRQAVCIALGFCVEKVPVVGVTYAPFLAGAFGPSGSGGVLWSSVRGRGAFQSHVHSAASSRDPTRYALARLVESGAIRLPLRNDPLPVDAPKGCLIAAEWGKDRREVRPRPARSLARCSGG